MANMALLSFYTIAFSGFLVMTVSAMAAKHNMKHAGDMHKMALIDKKKLEAKNDEIDRTARDAGGLEEFCLKFDQTQEMFHGSNIRSLEQLRSACSGRCAKCVNCSGSCTKKIAKGCRGLLKEMPPTLKIHSPLQENCRSFVN